MRKLRKRFGGRRLNARLADFGVHERSLRCDHGCAALPAERLCRREYRQTVPLSFAACAAWRMADLPGRVRAGAVYCGWGSTTSITWLRDAPANPSQWGTMTTSTRRATVRPDSMRSRAARQAGSKTGQTIATPNLSTSSGVFHHSLVRAEKEIGSAWLPI